MKVEELREPDQKSARIEPASGAQENSKLGLSVRQITPDEKRSVETEGSVVIEDVEGSAARAGLQPGDIILAVNNKQVNSVQDLRSAAGKLNKGDAAALLVERDGNRLFVPVRAG